MYLTIRKARSMRIAGLRLEGMKMRPRPTQIKMSGQFEATWAKGKIQYMFHHFWFTN